MVRLTPVAHRVDVARRWYTAAPRRGGRDMHPIRTGPDYSAKRAPCMRTEPQLAAYTLRKHTS